MSEQIDWRLTIPPYRVGKRQQEEMDSAKIEKVNPTTIAYGRIAAQLSQWFSEKDAHLSGCCHEIQRQLTVHLLLSMLSHASFKLRGSGLV
jgi:hypothetical protein